MSRTTTEQDFAQMGRDLAEAHVAKGNGHGVILDADGTLFENLLDGGEFQNFFFPEVITTASSNPKTNGGYAHPNTPIAKDVKVDGGNLVRSDGNVVRNPISPQGHQMLTAYFEALQKNGTPVYIVTMNRVGNIESVLGANGFLQYVSGISAIEGIHPVVNGEVGRVTEDSPSTHASTRSGEVKKLKAIKKIREDTKLGFDMIDDEFSRKGEIPTGFKGLVTEVSLMTAPKWISKDSISVYDDKYENLVKLLEGGDTFVYPSNEDGKEDENEDSKALLKEMGIEYVEGSSYEISFDGVNFTVSKSVEMDLPLFSEKNPDLARSIVAARREAGLDQGRSQAATTAAPEEWEEENIMENVGGPEIYVDADLAPLATGGSTKESHYVNVGGLEETTDTDNVTVDRAPVTNPTLEPATAGPTKVTSSAENDNILTKKTAAVLRTLNKAVRSPNKRLDTARMSRDLRALQNEITNRGYNGQSGPSARFNGEITRKDTNPENIINKFAEELATIISDLGDKVTDLDKSKVRAAAGATKISLSKSKNKNRRDAVANLFENIKNGGQIDGAKLRDLSRSAVSPDRPQVVVNDEFGNDQPLYVNVPNEEVKPPVAAARRDREEAEPVENLYDEVDPKEAIGKSAIYAAPPTLPAKPEVNYAAVNTPKRDLEAERNREREVMQRDKIITRLKVQAEDVVDTLIEMTKPDEKEELLLLAKDIGSFLEKESEPNASEKIIDTNLLKECINKNIESLDNQIKWSRYDGKNGAISLKFTKERDLLTRSKDMLNNPALLEIAASAFSAVREHSRALGQGVASLGSRFTAIYNERIAGYETLYAEGLVFGGGGDESSTDPTETEMPPEEVALLDALDVEQELPKSLPIAKPRTTGGRGGYSTPDQGHSARAAHSRKQTPPVPAPRPLRNPGPAGMTPPTERGVTDQKATVAQAERVASSGYNPNISPATLGESERSTKEAEFLGKKEIRGREVTFFKYDDQLHATYVRKTDNQGNKQFSLKRFTDLVPTEDQDFKNLSTNELFSQQLSPASIGGHAVEAVEPEKKYEIELKLQSMREETFQNQSEQGAPSPTPTVRGRSATNLASGQAAERPTGTHAEAANQRMSSGVGAGLG